MIFQLLSETKSDNCCKIHEGQHLAEVYQDANWKAVRINKEAFKYICIKCDSQRIYKII